MTNAAYTAGFMDKLAGYIKSAKSYSEMTPAEQKASDKAFAKAQEAFYKDTPQQEEIPESDGTLKGDLAVAGKKFTNQLKSWGRGALATAGTLGLRTGENVASMAWWMPELADSLILGKLCGVDNGRGLFGRYTGQFHRWMDKNVDSVRRWSSDYDYKHNVNSPLNRFMQGTFSDAVGSFAGFGGLHGLASRGLSKAMGVGFGGLGAYGALTDGQYKQLREREEKIRSMKPVFWNHVDPTSTAFNQENSPTVEEYHRYHMPSEDLPTTYSGRFRVPWSWGHDSWGHPTQFREYGT